MDTIKACLVSSVISIKVSTLWHIDVKHSMLRAQCCARNESEEQLQSVLRLFHNNVNGCKNSAMTMKEEH